MVKESFGIQALEFYKNLSYPISRLPKGIEVLDPYSSSETLEILKSFYSAYYNDVGSRIFLIGINPGRFGGGITGIPFTDPVNLEEKLGIQNSFDKKHELSSRFIYDVIDGMGGVNMFFKKFYLTAVSPLGFMRDHKNLNYYDDQNLASDWDSWIKDNLIRQVNFGANRTVAFSLGQGKNIRYLRIINDSLQLFKEIIPLPHPRWVMQYRYKKREFYVEEYCQKLNNYLNK